MHGSRRLSGVLLIMNQNIASRLHSTSPALHERDQGFISGVQQSRILTFGTVLAL